MNERPFVVRTQDTLGLVHAGIMSNDEAATAAAESVLSALVLHLKHPQCSLPGALRSRFDLLTTLR